MTMRDWWMRRRHVIEKPKSSLTVVPTLPVEPEAEDPAVCGLDSCGKPLAEDGPSLYYCGSEHQWLAMQKRAEPLGTGPLKDTFQDRRGDAA